MFQEAQKALETINDLVSPRGANLLGVSTKGIYEEHPFYFVLFRNILVLTE